VRPRDVPAESTIPLGPTHQLNTGCRPGPPGRPFLGSPHPRVRCAEHAVLPPCLNAAKKPEHLASVELLACAGRRTPVLGRRRRGLQAKVPRTSGYKCGARDLDPPPNLDGQGSNVRGGGDRLTGTASVVAKDEAPPSACRLPGARWLVQPLRAVSPSGRVASKMARRRRRSRRRSRRRRGVASCSMPAQDEKSVLLTSRREPRRKKLRCVTTAAAAAEADTNGDTRGWSFVEKNMQIQAMSIGFSPGDRSFWWIAVSGSRPVPPTSVSAMANCFFLGHWRPFRRPKP